MRSAASHRQVLSGVMWVPPIQRSMPRSSTRSASPRSALLAGCRQPQLESCEELAVAERRRRGKRCAVVGLEEPRRSLPERGEGSVEPGVAEEGRLLEPLRRDEGGGRRARAGGDRLERPSFRPREPVRRRGQLLEQPPQRGGEKRQLRGLTRRPLGQCRRLRRLEGGPGARRRLRARPVPPGGARARASRARSPSARPDRRTTACRGRSR